VTDGNGDARSENDGSPAWTGDVKRMKWRRGWRVDDVRRSIDGQRTSFNKHTKHSRLIFCDLYTSRYRLRRNFGNDVRRRTYANMQVLCLALHSLFSSVEIARIPSHSLSGAFSLENRRLPAVRVCSDCTSRGVQ